MVYSRQRGELLMQTDEEERTLSEVAQMRGFEPLVKFLDRTINYRQRHVLPSHTTYSLDHVHDC